MGRVRGRGKKQMAVTVIADAASGEEEKIPTQRRRGRPQKPAKDHASLVDEGYGDKAVENGDVPEEDSAKDVKKTDDAVAGTVRKRKRSVKDGNGNGNGNSNGIVATDHDEEENGIKHPKLETKDGPRFVGFRTNGNRRKNKPRRAAEAGVECK